MARVSRFERLRIIASRREKTHQRLLNRRTTLYSAFGGADLFPFPDSNVYMFGDKPKQRSAWGYLRRIVLLEVRQLHQNWNCGVATTSQPWSDPVRYVLWRHTGGLGNKACFFMMYSEKEQCVLLRFKRSRRWLWEPVTDDSLSCLPDAAFQSAADTIHKWRKDPTHQSWFPESRDAHVRDMSIFKKHNKHNSHTAIVPLCVMSTRDAML